MLCFSAIDACIHYYTLWLKRRVIFLKHIMNAYVQDEQQIDIQTRYKLKSLNIKGHNRSFIFKSTKRKLKGTVIYFFTLYYNIDMRVFLQWIRCCHENNDKIGCNMSEMIYYDFEQELTFINVFIVCTNVIIGFGDIFFRELLCDPKLDVINKSIRFGFK